MKVLLINPSQYQVYGKMKAPTQMHMGLAYIGAVLEEHKYDVELVDIDSDMISEKRLAQIFSSEKVDLVGITVTTPTLNSSISLAKRIKEISPSTRIALGGMHPSVDPVSTISHEWIDYVIKGEGEETFLELLSALEGKKDLSDIGGLVFKKNGEVFANKDRELIADLDTLPFPARHLFKNKGYTYPDALYARTTPMITSRGCPGRCTYCNAHSIFGKRFRARSSRNVVDEVEHLVKHEGIKEIHIWDDNFVTKKERVYKIADEILKRNLKVKFAFPNGIRADYIDRKLLQALKRMGTYSISIGVESGNQSVLDRAKKGVKLERVEEAFRLAKELKLETWAFFMLGLPGEDVKAVNDTVSFARRIDPDIAKFHILKPYPGTEVYDYLSENSLLSTKDFENYGIHTPPVHHLHSLSEDDILKLQRRAYASFYLRPRKILNQIWRMKTINRLKLNINSAFDIVRLILKR